MQHAVQSKLPRLARAMRERIGLTQAEASRRLWCSPQAISDYECGTRPVPDAYLIALANLVSIIEPDDPTPLRALDARLAACDILAARREILARRTRTRRAA